MARIPAPQNPQQSLWPCPPLLNCVSTQGLLIYNTPTFLLKPGKEDFWKVVIASVDDLPRTRVVLANDYYIKAKSHSAVFRFVDHLEVLYHSDTNILEVRSVAVLGLFDFGVNRYRVSQLRKMLQKEDVIY